MRLSEYLDMTGEGYATFGRRIGLASAGNARRYASGERVPRRDVMQRIVVATGGAVQPNDFFPAAPEPRSAPTQEQAA
jgi:hypothetical protein